MTLQAADSMNISIGDGNITESFAIIASIADIRIELENTPIIDTSIRQDRWQMQKEAAGKQKITLSIQGFFSDTAAEETLRLQAFSHNTANYEIDFGNGDTLSGPFQVTRYERYGNLRDVAEGFLLRLQSNGEATFSKG